LVHEQSVYPSLAGLPLEVKSDFLLHQDPNEYLIVYFDHWWSLSSHLLLVNDTVKTLPLSLSYSSMNPFAHRMERTMDESWRLQQSMGTHTEAETDSLKRILLESNPYLLLVTFIVSILHSVFDFLAFKNDISFYRETKHMGGLSSRAVFLGFVAQIIIFLYLLDNETSYMILVSSGIGLLIEGWKLSKAFDLSVKPTFPFVNIANKRVETNEKGEALREEDKLVLATQIYDREAMTYMSFALYPLLIIYAGYSLYTATHKGYYSFVISTLVGAVYTFGFVQMAPQLYINYKLKSVAHMPWRMLAYKFTNTIIDDLFAFIITMPTLHRLSAFRDDIIFVIFLYQRYIYSVDDERVNEFGLSGSQIKEAQRRKKAGLPPLNPSKKTEPAPTPVIATATPLVEEKTKEEVDEGEAKEPSLRRRTERTH